MVSLYKKTLWLVLAGALALGIVACSDDGTPAEDASNDTANDTVGDGYIGDTAGDTGSSDDTAIVPTAPLVLSRLDVPIGAGDSYYVPDNNSDPASSAVAIFSEQKDLLALSNASAAQLTITGVTFTGVGDAVDEEFRVCSSDSGVNRCTPYVAGAIEAGASSDFYVHFYPVQSGQRSATLRIDYTTAEGADSLAVTIVGHGRISSDALPAKLFTDATISRHKLWGGYNTNHDELPGPMVADAAGNVFFAGTASGFIGDAGNPDKNIFLVKLNADGSLGWEKQYHSTDHDEITATGDNLGLGAADALIYGDDGYLYMTGKAANGAGNKGLALVMKIDPADGSAVWMKYWFHDVDRLQYTDSSSGTAIDIVGDRLFVVGGKNVFSMKTDGSLLWSIRVHPQGNTSVASRLHTVRYDGAGNLYVAGIDYSSGASGPFIGKLSGVTDAGNSLALAWAKTLDLGDAETGSNIDSMDIDANGNLYLAVDRRGATTRFTVAQMAADGTSFMAKTLPGSAGDRNNIYVVRALGDSLYVGGRTGQPGWDVGNGDGLIGKLATSDLSVDWAAVYYTGVSPTVVCHHSVHGMATSGSDVHVMGQVYTGNANFYRYWGYWYDFPQQAEDWSPDAVVDVTSSTTFEPLPRADFVDSSHNDFVNDGQWSDLDSATFNVEYQDATAKGEATNGSATDADVFIMKLSAP